MIKNRRILFGVASLGLGHASRDLPIMKKYAGSNELFVVSTSNALDFLKKELGTYAYYQDFKDYPKFQRGKGIKYYSNLVMDVMKLDSLIEEEHLFVQKFVQDQKIDLIVSDGKYGFYSKDAPSVLITHQTNLALPKPLQPFAHIINRLHLDKLAKMDMVLIPDYDSSSNLSGKLSHNQTTEKLRHEYIGILSAYSRTEIVQDIDFYVIISGYLNEHKNSFVHTLLRELKNIPGKKVFVLGDTQKEEHQILSKDLEIYSYVSGSLRNELMNRSKTVISRSGYTTLLDLMELDRKALLVPTPGQTEQEYLAEYLRSRGYYASMLQDRMDFETLEQEIAKSEPLKNNHKTTQSLEKIDNLLTNLL